MKTFYGVWTHDPEDADGISFDFERTQHICDNGGPAILALEPNKLMLSPDSWAGKHLARITRELGLSELSGAFLESIGVSRNAILEKYVFIGDDSIAVVYANNIDNARDVMIRVTFGYGATSAQAFIA